MNTVLYTGFNPAYFPLAKLTMPLMVNYSKRHGFGMHVATELFPPFTIYWTGVCVGLQLLMDGADRVIYLDIDQMVTNQQFSITDHMVNFQHGFHCPRDWGEDAVSGWDISACCLIMHQDCIPLLERIIELEPEFRDRPFPEQAPMRAALQESDIWPAYPWGRKPFNCVPDQVCPGKVPEPWEPGDWCAHLTMLPLDKRIELFHELSK